METSAAETVPQYIYAQGVAQPFRTADVISTTGGKLDEVPVQQGDQVDAATVLARVRLEERQSQLASAEARVESLEADLEGMRRLERQGFAAETRVRELESQLESQAEVLRAYGPFPGADHVHGVTLTVSTSNLRPGKTDRPRSGEWKGAPLNRCRCPCGLGL